MSKKQINNLHLLDQQIGLQSTGTPAELAKKLHISVSSLYDLFSLAKKLGAQITYNKNSRTYEYTKPMRFVFGFFEDQNAMPNKK